MPACCASGSLQALDILSRQNKAPASQICGRRELSEVEPGGLDGIWPLTTSCPNAGLQNICQKLKTLIRHLPYNAWWQPSLKDTQFPSCARAQPRGFCLTSPWLFLFPRTLFILAKSVSLELQFLRPQNTSYLQPPAVFLVDRAHALSAFCFPYTVFAGLWGQGCPSPVKWFLPFSGSVWVHYHLFLKGVAKLTF